VAELRTIARPYAQALFELAQAGDNLASWSQALSSLAVIVKNPDVASLIGNPGVASEALADAVIGIAGDNMDKQGANLVRLLSHNDRLSVAPEITAQFEDLRAKAEDRVDVEVTAAAELSEEQQQQITKSLKNRLKREIRLSCVTDPDMIGGLVVRAGDLVIDGSLRASLARMQQTLAH